MSKFTLFVFVLSLFALATCYTITPITKDALLFGYTPYWDEKTNNVFLIDVDGSNGTYFYRWDCKEKRMYSAGFNGRGYKFPTFIRPVAGYKDRYVIAGDRFVAMIKWNGISKTVDIIDEGPVIEPYSTNSFDSAGVDPKGRLVVGTSRDDGCVPTSDPYAAVYMINDDGNVETLIEGVNATTGLAWNEEEEKMYYMNVCDYSIYEYDWSPETGRIKNPRKIYSFPATYKYKLVGMEIDCHGNLFVGLYRLSQIVEINPRKKKIENVIYMPGQTISGMCFAGLNSNKMFVTTSSILFFITFDLNGPRGVKVDNPLAGQVFLVENIHTKACPIKRVKGHF